MQTKIGLNSEITLRNAALFPIQSGASFLDVCFGALLMSPFLVWLVAIPLDQLLRVFEAPMPLLPQALVELVARHNPLLFLLAAFGWVLNQGHRINIVHKMMVRTYPWPAWEEWGRLFRDGVYTIGGMVLYHLPSLLLGRMAAEANSPFLFYGGAVPLWIIATMAVPGYMSHYCAKRDPREIFDPFRALRRIALANPIYWKAWCNALFGLCVSLSIPIAALAIAPALQSGAQKVFLMLAGALFLVASTWFWQMAGFSFAMCFSRRFSLTEIEQP